MLGKLTALSLVFSVLYVSLLHEFVGNLEERSLARRHDQLLAQLEQQQTELQDIASSLNRIHDKDNSFYRSILNMEKIDPSVWEGGVGGDVKRVPASTLGPESAEHIAAHAEELEYKMNLQQKSFKKLMRMAKAKSEELRHIPAIRPIDHARLISNFGYRRDPFHGRRTFHYGIDFTCRTGTPVKSVGDGVVVTAGRPQSGYGIQVEIDHGFGFVTKYAHLSKLKVQVGDRIKRGQVIALAGNTGRSTGSHLHYEVIKQGKKRNPIEYFYTR